MTQKPWKQMPRKRRAHRGFTLVETLMVMVIFGMIIGLLAWLTGDTGRLGKETMMDATMSSAGRLRLDTFINDVRDSSDVLASWKDPNTGTTYTSHLTNATSSPPTYYATLVLEAPAYDASNKISTIQQPDGTLRPSYYDHIIYQVEPVASSPLPLYTLNRLVITDGHSARIATPDTVLARDVATISFTCLVDQAFDGTGTQTIFSLKAPVSTSGSDVVAAATVGGATQNQPADVQYTAPTTAEPDGTLLFTIAPAAGAHVDALYSVDCNAGNQGLVTGVSLDLIMAMVDPSLTAAAQKQTLELSGRANLHNH